MEVKIFIATHKKFNYKPLEGYYPIQVGAEISKENFGYLLDNINSNISSKNKNYCELTAYYWIWKNVNADIVGLCHYRRYLSKKNNLKWKYILTTQDIENDLRKYDIILPAPNTWKGYSCYDFYIQAEGKEKDLIATRDIIKDKYPEYIESFDYILNGNTASYCNVMISTKKLFDTYCEWLFSILFELEKNIDITNYTIAEARVYGYISELLLNVWVYHNQLKIKYYHLINTENPNSFVKKVQNRLNKMLKD